MFPENILICDGFIVLSVVASICKISSLETKPFTLSLPLYFCTFNCCAITIGKFSIIKLRRIARNCLQLCSFSVAKQCESLCGKATLFSSIFFLTILFLYYFWF